MRHSLFALIALATLASSLAPRLTSAEPIFCKRSYLNEKTQKWVVRPDAPCCTGEPEWKDCRSGDRGTPFKTQTECTFRPVAAERNNFLTGNVWTCRFKPGRR